MHLYVYTYMYVCVCVFVHVSVLMAIHGLTWVWVVSGNLEAEKSSLTIVIAISCFRGQNLYILSPRERERDR